MKPFRVRRALAQLTSYVHEHTIDQIILLDTHGLWGGQDVWIYSNGAAVCRTVRLPGKGESGLQETRFSFTVTPRDISKLIEVIEKNRFFSLKSSERCGLPDETRPVIAVISGCKIHAVSKWADDRYIEFDDLYRLLRTIIDYGKEGKLFGAGTYDVEWNPAGFIDNASVRDCATR